MAFTLMMTTQFQPLNQLRDRIPARTRSLLEYIARYPDKDFTLDDDHDVRRLLTEAGMLQQMDVKRKRTIVAISLMSSRTHAIVGLYCYHAKASERGFIAVTLSKRLHSPCEIADMGTNILKAAGK